MAVGLNIFLAIFVNGHYVAEVYFYESNSRKSATFAASGARAAKFSFSKYHRDLKMNFFLHLQRPSFLLHRTIAHFFFIFSSDFAFKPIEDC